MINQQYCTMNNLFPEANKYGLAIRKQMYHPKITASVNLRYTCLAASFGPMLRIWARSRWQLWHQE